MKSKLIAYKDSKRAGRPRDREFTVNHYSGFKFALYKPLKVCVCKRALRVEISVEEEFQMKELCRRLSKRHISLLSFFSIACIMNICVPLELVTWTLQATFLNDSSFQSTNLRFVQAWAQIDGCYVSYAWTRVKQNGGRSKESTLWQKRPTMLNFLSRAENDHYTKMRNERKCV